MVCHIKCLAVPEDEHAQEGEREAERIPSGHWPTLKRSQAEALDACRAQVSMVQGDGTSHKGPGVESAKICVEAANHNLSL